MVLDVTYNSSVQSSTIFCRNRCADLMTPMAILNTIGHAAVGCHVEIVPLTELEEYWKLDRMGKLLTKVRLSDKLMMQMKDNRDLCCSYLSAAATVHRV